MAKSDTLLARLDEKTKYIVEKIDSLHKTLETSQERNETRIESLERWRNWLTGAYFAGAGIVSVIFMIILK